MPSLLELQRRVMDAILDGDAAGAAALITRHGRRPNSIASQCLEPRGLGQQSIAAARRLNIYAVTAQTNFIDSLISSYPAVRRLVGADYFAQCARSFHRRHPSVSGDLQPAGLEFAQYLAELHGADEYGYLGDVARLEWLIQEALLAAAHAPFDLGKLARVAPEDYDELRFQLHPTVRLFDSPYPCVHIWQANMQTDAQPEMIDLAEGGDRVLLMRGHDGRLSFHLLSRGEATFLRALSTGERFAAAVAAAGGDGASDSASNADGDGTSDGDGDGDRDGDRDRDRDGDGDGTSDGEFDAAAALQRFVLAGAIVDFR